MGQIAIIGNGVEAWLAASICARFMAAKPSDVHVHIQGETSLDGDLTIRPDMARLHYALGLDLSNLNGAQATDVWMANGGYTIPLTPFGKPLGAVAFHHLLTRIGQGDRLDRASLANDTPICGAWRIATQTYAAALENIARQAGVSVGSTPIKSTLLVGFEKSDSASCWRENGLSLGWQMFGSNLPRGLRLHAIHTSLMTLVSHWPGGEWLPVEQRALDNRITALKSCLIEMTGLLSGDLAAHPRLAHRVDMWRTCGRLIPVDNDPFAASEWIAALTASLGPPQGYDRLADRFSLDEIFAHIAKYSAKEAANV